MRIHKLTQTFHYSMTGFVKAVIIASKLAEGCIAAFSKPSSLEHRTGALVCLISRVWVRVPVVTLDYYNCVLLMRGRAVGLVSYVMHPVTLIAKRRGLP